MVYREPAFGRAGDGYEWREVLERWLEPFLSGLEHKTRRRMLDRATDGDALRMHVQHILAPTLKRGDVVVVDNLPAHKVAGICEAIADRGAQISSCDPTVWT